MNAGAVDEEPEGYAAERSRRIEETVARDLARRRRLIRIYLALLLVPLAVAAAHALYGRTDRQMVAWEVEQRVEPVERSYQEIAAMLEDVRGVGELLPEIRGVGERIQTYEQGQEELDQRVAEVAAEVGEIKPAVAEVAELRRAYDVEQRRLASRIDAFELRLGPAAAEEGAASRQPAAGFVAVPTFERLSGRTAALEKQQAELARQLALLSAGAPPERPPADLAALDRRLKDLERTVDTLEQEVRRLRAELSRYRPPR